MSFSHFEKQKAKLFSGISTVTSNRDEVSEKGKIPSMWSLYREKFPHTERQDIRRDTIALYSDYETDEHGTYTFSIGTFVDQQEKTANLISLPASEYAVFVSKRGRIAEVVFETWQEIWTWDEKIFVLIPEILKFMMNKQKIPKMPKLPSMLLSIEKNNACKTNAISFKMKTNGISFLF